MRLGTTGLGRGISRLLGGLLTATLLAAATPLPAATAVSAAVSAPFHGEKLHPELRQKVTTAGPDDRFTVVLRGRGKPQVEAVRYRGDDVVAALKAATAKSQKPVVRFLEARGAQVLRQFWLIDALVANVDKPTLESLTNLAEVAAVHENFAVTAPPVEKAASGQEGEVTWGVGKIEANRVWNELGVDGTGVRVAVLDTGVEIKHPDLAGKMATDNPGDPTYPGGWMEFDENGGLVSSQPHDSAGHGTHVSGTIAGGNASGTAIGVAPGATLMHGLVLPGGGGTFAQVVAGMQWAVEPTDAAGNPAGQRPQIASMSWGAGGLHSEMMEPLRNMLLAGVLPIAAIGNCGAGCVGSPGAIFESFGIGASASDDTIAEFSSGAQIKKSEWSNPPDEWPDQWVKPDLSAPGVDVLSSVPGGGYERWAGTSMATPHVSGAAALMLSANPSLTPDAILATLQESSFWDDRYGSERPNIRFGHGRIDAFEAVSRIAYKSGITGRVTDAGTKAPIDQATVLVAGTTQKARTKADGSFSLTLKPGTYTLTVERFGYEPATIPNVSVVQDQKSSVDVTLTALPTGTISGTVAYDRTGFGIPGVTVRVEGVPIGIQAETDAEGRYELRLPVGSYSLSVNGFGFTTATAAGLAVVADGATPQDFVLAALPRVAVVGDIDDVLTRFLGSHGYVAERAGLDVATHVGDYSAVILNMVGGPGPKEFGDLVDGAETAGVGLLFTKGWGSGWGIDLLQQTYGDPATTSYNWWPLNLDIQVTAEHPELLPGRAVGDRFSLIPNYPDVAWFDGYSGTSLADLTNSTGTLGRGVAIKQNAGNRHVLLASFGATPWQGPDNWTPESQELFLNALKWAAKPDTGGAKFVEWGLEGTPDTVLWHQPVTAQVSVKNIGDATGTKDVALMVNGGVEAVQSLALGPNEHQTATYTVQREPVGAYQMQVGHLAASFRVRPPKVTVKAQTISLPASGKGKNLDPGEPAIPLVDAQVDLVQGGKVISRGKLDKNGALTFDSTASRADYTIVVHRTNYGYNLPRHYLLTLPVHVEDDSAYGFAPQAADTVRLDAALTAKGASHHGSIFLANGATGQTAFEFPTGSLVLTPGDYRTAYVMAYDVPGSQWAYASKWESRTLASGTTTYQFGGDFSLTMGDVRGQAAPKAQVDWSTTDSFSHPLAAVFQVTAGAFGPVHSRSVSDIATWPATVAATAKSEQKPLLTLTNPLGAIEQTGSIGWAEQPRQITFVPSQVLTGEYVLQLRADTGPYMGTLEAASTLLLPARSVSRTLLMPGDTFDVTVIFDAGAAGDLTLTETLPAGFTIARQSSVPASSFAGSTWTWHPSGKGAYRPGQTMKVTYTVRVGPEVTAGVYSLTGNVAQSGTIRMIAGPQTVEVVQ